MDNEGLEALEDFKKEYCVRCIGICKDCELSIIEKELKDYQQLEEILNDYGLTLVNFREACLLLAMLKGEGRNIHNIDKQLKALEIIKKKNFDLYYLQDSKDLDQYNDCCDHYRNLCYLTQEEYELLKEVLL